MILVISYLNLDEFIPNEKITDNDILIPIFQCAKNPIVKRNRKLGIKTMTPMRNTKGKSTMKSLYIESKTITRGLKK